MDIRWIEHQSSVKIRMIRGLKGILRLDFRDICGIFCAKQKPSSAAFGLKAAINMIISVLSKIKIRPGNNLTKISLINLICYGFTDYLISSGIYRSQRIPFQ